MSTHKTPPKESTKQIDSVDKALCLLECFNDSAAQLSLKQLSEKTGLYKSRILRLCGTLMAHGFLVRLEGSVYTLGPKTLVLGKVYERSNTLVSLARPIMREVARDTGEATKLFVIDGDSRICLVKEKGTAPLQYAIEEGERHALHAGAGGKILLAYAEETFREHILSMGLPKLTPSTMIDIEAFRAELTTIRQQGYAISKSELALGVTGIAVPVFDYRRSICAALTITGSTPQMDKPRTKRIIAILEEAAQQLSILLGFSVS